MLRELVLHAIADAVDHDEDEAAAFSALGRVDPILRFAARRKLRMALTQALLNAPVHNPAADEPEDNAHALRLAYLALAGVSPSSQSPLATIRAFARCRRSTHPGSSGRWWLTGVLSLLAALAISCGGVLGYQALRPEPASPPDPPPAPTGAFAHGGRPAPGGPVLDRALGRDLPDFLIALDAWRRVRGQGMPTGEPARRLAELEAAQDRLQARRVRVGLGENAAHWLHRLLQVARELATTRRLDRLTKTYTQTVVAFNDALAARGLGYYLDSDFVSAAGDERYVILYVFRVERVKRFAADRRIVRALQLRRLDHLSWAHGALGFTRPEHHEALVLLDAVDDILVTYLLPALGESSMPLTDAATARSGLTWPAEISTRSAAAIRTELARVNGLTPARAQQLTTLLTRRRTLIKRWQKTLGERGYAMVEPTGLTMGWDYRRVLGRVIDASELAQMDRLERELSAPDVRRTLATLRRLVAASVAHHEVQHRLDYDWLASRTLPGKLKKRLGPLHHRGRVRRRVQRARDELSAYLAELARSRGSTQLELALISRFVFDQGHAGGAEYHAARIILEGLAARCGLVLATQSRADRARYALLYLQLTRKPSGTLRRAAQRLWEDLFGTELPTLRKL